MTVQDNPRPIYVLPAEATDTPMRLPLASALTFLWNCRYWLALFAVLGILAGTLAFFVSTKIYHADTLLAPVQSDHGSSALGGLSSKFGGLASLAGINLSGGSNSRVETLAVLTASGFIRDFITHHNLMPVLYSRIWDPTRKTWTVSNPRKIPTLSDAVHYFSTRVMIVKDDKDTGLVTLSIEWKDPQLAAQWANMLVADLNKRLRGRAIAESEGHVKYLDNILRKGNIPDVEQRAIYSLIETQMGEAMVANVRKQFALKVLDPAIAPDADKFVRPNLILLVFLGLVFSCILGLIIRVMFWDHVLFFWDKLRGLLPGR